MSTESYKKLLEAAEECLSAKYPDSIKLNQEELARIVLTRWALIKMLNPMWETYLFKEEITAQGKRYSVSLSFDDLLLAVEKIIRIEEKKIKL